MGLFERFPYTNFHELNSTWIIEELIRLKTTIEQFVSINALKYADPIQWNITKQYEKNTIVIDPLTGTAYISVQPVPSGVAITNTDYWTVVFDLGSFVVRAAKNFTDKFEEATTLTATFASAVNDWLIWGDVLYRVVSPIVAGDQYVIGSNIEHFTAEVVIGHIQDLDTTDQSNLVAAINELVQGLADEATRVNNITGSLDDLDTTDQSNLVAAINEIFAALGDISDLRTQDTSNVVNAINELADKTVWATPQLYGAKGDGVTDDTDAFIALSTDNRNIIIPKGSYVISSPVTIADVIIDEGSYPNYLPMYAKKLELPLRALTWIKQNILLNSYNEYEESACYHEGKYYVITNEFSTSSNGIIVYDEDFNILSHVSSPKTTVGTCNSCCTDGEYLYVDYDSGYHRKYDLNDLTTPVVQVSTAYRNTGYYNKQLYAIIISATSVSVAKLNAAMDTMTDMWTVPFTLETLQSSTIYNGQLYITNVFGHFTVIDLVSHESLNVLYDNEPWEIEGFFEKDGKLCSVGHAVSTEGTFNVSAFDFGICPKAMNLIEIDASVTSMDFRNDVAYRGSFYHVVNGLTEGILPSNDCIVQWADKNLICYSVADNRIWYFDNNTWNICGLFEEITVNYSDAGIGSGRIVVRRDLTVEVVASNLHLSAVSDYTFSVDASAIYALKGWSNSKSCMNFSLAGTYGSGMNADIYAVRVTLEINQLIFEIKSLLGIDSPNNAYVRCTVSMN